MVINAGALPGPSIAFRLSVGLCGNRESFEEIIFCFTIGQGSRYCINLLSRKSGRSCFRLFGFGGCIIGGDSRLESKKDE
jgi:hypothetical protein